MLISIQSGFYQARSVIASAQRCVNLYPEINERESFLMLPQLAGASAIVTTYPTPGLTAVTVAANGVGWRGLYRANNGVLYGVCGNYVYRINANYQLTQVGVLSGLRTNPVSMVDNGTTLVLVDGSSAGYLIDLVNDAFSVLTDSTGTFTGSNRVGYIDSFLLFAQPGTRYFYTSLSNEVAFDPLYIAAKTGFADSLVTIEALQGQLWLLGERTTEVWYDAGNPLFPFARANQGYIAHGCMSAYSVANNGEAVLWLSQNEHGRAQVMAGSNYSATRVSTHAIENEIQQYSTLAQAVAHMYQVEGHTFYALSFPAPDDRTWVYDLTTQLWHEETYSDGTGGEHRSRVQVACEAYGQNFAGDWESGVLYIYDLDNYTVNNQPVRRVRSFPHLVNELKRLSYSKFVADMQTGASTNPNDDPTVWLRWSDDRGATWGSAIPQSLGRMGQSKTNLQWRHLGIARDKVFELSWSSAAPTALNQAFVEVIPCQT